MTTDIATAEVLPRPETIRRPRKLDGYDVLDDNEECGGRQWIKDDNDSYTLQAFKQTYGEWPVGRSLPLPMWSREAKPTLVFQKMWQYEDVVAKIEMALQRTLEDTHYDTVHNFLNFYTAFKRSRQTNLKSFFEKYLPPINRRHHMCVSLAMEMVAKMSEIDEILGDHAYLVSCEEAVESIKFYVTNCEKHGIENSIEGLEKEHALVAMKICVEGREGVLVLDPGYHVARAVTVMRDHAYPHTGWFTQSLEPQCKREYCYSFNATSPNFIEWTERSTRTGGAAATHETALVYIERPYRTAVDVTVRRNLVYNFRSLLSRNAKGRVLAGIYFPVGPVNSSEPQFTVFYEGANRTPVKTKVKFSAFKDAKKVNYTNEMLLAHKLIAFHFFS